MKTSMEHISENRASRLRARVVDAVRVLRDAVKAAAVSNRGMAAVVEHGGTVPNCYDYPADTEVVGAVAVRTRGQGGRAIVRYSRMPANKATLSGAAARTIGYRAPWDCRMGLGREREAWQALREIAWRGDILWRETDGGIEYSLDGSEWRRA